jgi:hypothetical protein
MFFLHERYCLLHVSGFMKQSHVRNLCYLEMPRLLIEECTSSVLFLFHSCILCVKTFCSIYVEHILLTIGPDRSVIFLIHPGRKCVKPNSVNVTVHFHFSITSFVFASYSFTLSYSLSSQDLSSVLNAGDSLIQTLL